MVWGDVMIWFGANIGMIAVVCMAILALAILLWLALLLGQYIEAKRVKIPISTAWKHNLFSACFSLIAVVAWITNLGYITLIFSLVVICHIRCHIIVNIKNSKHNHLSKYIKNIALIENIIHPLVYMILWDSDRISHHTFFRLIQRENMNDMWNIPSAVLFVADIVLIITWIVIAHKEKKKLKMNEGI